MRSAEDLSRIFRWDNGRVHGRRIPRTRGISFSRPRPRIAWCFLPGWEERPLTDTAGRVFHSFHPDISPASARDTPGAEGIPLGTPHSSHRSRGMSLRARRGHRKDVAPKDRTTGRPWHRVTLYELAHTHWAGRHSVHRSRDKACAEDSDCWPVSGRGRQPPSPHRSLCVRRG